MDWVWLALYGAGFLYTARRVAIAALEDTAQFTKRLRGWRKPEPGERLVDTEDRLMALLGGVVAGLIWPAALVAMWIVKGLRAPTEIAWEKERELEELRALAKKHNLPMPNQEE